MADPQTVQNVTLVKDSLLAIAAIASVGIGYLGLQTWQRQLKGTAHFEAARQHAHAALKLREAIREARSPLVSAGEFTSPRDRTNPDVEADAWGPVYTNRMKPVWEAVTELDAACVQTEALLGPDVRAASDLYRALAFRLWSSFVAMVDNIRSRHTDFVKDPAFGARVRADVAAVPSQADNPLTMEINQRLENLLAILRPHLIS